MARGASDIADDKGKPKPFDRTYPDGRAHPDIVAINTKEKKVLILDLTKKPGGTIELKPGDRRPLPDDAPPSEQVKLHLEKTIDDAKQLTRRPPGGENIDGFKVVARERYWATGEYSREFAVGKITEPTPDVLAAEAKERADRRAAKAAEKAREDAERAAKKKKKVREGRGREEGAREAGGRRAGARQARSGEARGRGARARQARPGEAREARPGRAGGRNAREAGARQARETGAGETRPGEARAREARLGAETVGLRAERLEAERRTRQLDRERGIQQAAGAIQAKALKQLNQLAQKHPGDKDLVEVVDTLNTALDAESLLEDPKGFLAEKMKAALIQGVFDHFAKPLKTARQKFETKCPSVGALHADPLDTGVSLEGYEELQKALAALRVPSDRKKLILLYYLLGTNDSTPKEGVEQRIALANAHIARLPGVAKYIKQYNDAKDRYNFALFAVTNQVNLRGDELAEYAGVADELRIRAKALEAAAKILNDAARELWESPFIAFVVVLGAAQDLETLGEGFAGLASQLREFADTIDRREGE